MKYEVRGRRYLEGAKLQELIAGHGGREHAFKTLMQLHTDLLSPVFVGQLSIFKNWALAWLVTEGPGIHIQPTWYTNILSNRKTNINNVFDRRELECVSLLLWCVAFFEVKLQCDQPASEKALDRYWLHRLYKHTYVVIQMAKKFTARTSANFELNQM